MKFKNLLYIFAIAMLPVIELRGAIPVGASLNLPFYENYICAVLGNLLPVPFILIFIPKILEWLGQYRFFKPIVNWLHRKANKNKAKIVKTNVTVDGENAKAEVLSTDGKKRTMSVPVFIELMLFVMIPLPMTGAWTGALVAALFDFHKRYSFLAILLGVLGSGVIMCLASYGVVEFLKIFI